MEDPDLMLFGQVPALLGRKDDTSRFVALTILRTIIDSKPEVRENEQAVLKIWRTIPKKFLVRLLKSTPSEKVNTELSNDLKHLAVGIIHTFLCMLVQDLNQLEAKEVVPLNIPLLNALPALNAPQKMLGWQTLQLVAENSRYNNLFETRLFHPDLLAYLRDDERALAEALKFFRIARLSWEPIKYEPGIAQQIENWNWAIAQLLTSMEARPSAVFDMLADVVGTGVVRQFVLLDV
jgi:Neurochondrin